ncbi:type II toxin-antitoxin system HicB family antitoxin [Photorhabdus aegyptia]|uniref:Hypervariable junctions of pilus protein n=1 Tax=Photorhabdus aegyptia TaxID=2805098 RepID=A0A022PNW4_9GAMM|nr:type II toxin-antitoxin system HicB family antitoxin [Photorhabdus aegyptia]EYU16135.1 hypervariable junctions of pilus protein [Photorhabdus aegyptia]
MKYLKYKGYSGTIEFDLENNTLFGKLEYIRDLVTYEAKTIVELENEFKISIDLYLQDCKELNKNPDVSYKGIFNVRVNPELHRKIAELALEEDVTVNAFVNQALENEVSKHHVGS